MSKSRVWKAARVVAVAMVAVAAVGAALLTVIIPAATGSKSLNVLTGSMSPTIPAGSVILVKPVDPSTINVGDVITFQAEPGKPVYITHRVVELDQNEGQLSFVTKGDANRGDDVEPVPAGAVRGRVIFHVPFVGTISNSARTPLGLLVLVALPCTYYIVSQGRKIRDDVQARRSLRPASGGVDLTVDSAAPESLSIERSMLMAQVASVGSERSKLLSLVSTFGASIVDVQDTDVIFTVVGTATLLDRVEAELDRWPNRQVRRSSVVTIRLSDHTASDLRSATLQDADPVPGAAIIAPTQVAQVAEDVVLPQTSGAPGSGDAPAEPSRDEVLPNQSQSSPRMDSDINLLSDYYDWRIDA